jgi:glycosyltransferase involved in cell wall biosynthesis
MKLVLVADTFPPQRTSAAVQLRDLSRECARQDHEVTVLLPDAEIAQPWALHSIDGVQVLRLAAPRTKEVGNLRRALAECLMPYAMGRNLRRSPLAGQHWDGIIWYSPSIFHGPLICALKRHSACKAYLIIRDIFPEWAVDIGILRRGLAYRFFKRIARQQYDVADVIGVQSPGNLVYFDQWQNAQPRRRVEVLQNWLEPAATARCSIRVAQTPLQGRKIFVYAGNMGVAQGMDRLLDLAQRMQQRWDIGFLFVGRGTDARRLKDLAQARGLDNTLFHDEIDPDEIPDLYAQCSAGIVNLDPRHKSHNIPGKFLSYMQSGLPVLANINPGNDLAQLIASQQLGQVCDTNDLDDLHACCLRLLAQIETDAALPQRCRDVFQRQFSVAQIVQQLVQALRPDIG